VNKYQVRWGSNKGCPQAAPRKHIAKYLLNMLKFLKKILLVILGTAVALLIFEIGLRTISKHSFKIRQLTYDSERQVSFGEAPCALEPGSLVNGFRVNSNGFLTPEVSYNKSQDEFRIVLLGDSFAVGVVPYELHFIRLLEKYLNDNEMLNHIKNFQVVNLGLACVGTGMELELLRLEGVKYQPDLVILGFFIGNDFIDPIYTSKLFDKKKERLEDLRIISLIKNLYIIKTSLPNYGSQKIKPSHDKLYGFYTGEGLQGYNPFKPTFELEDYLEIEAGRLGVYQQGSSAYENLAQIKREIISMERLVEENNGEFLVLIIPDELQVNPSLLKQTLEYRGISKEEVDLGLPGRVLKDFFAENNIDYVDLLSYFETNNQSRVLYQPNDSHFNSTGNKEVAEILYSHIAPQVLGTFDDKVNNFLR